MATGMLDGASRISLWEATAVPAPDTMALDRDVSVDVGVIGGGFCGLSFGLRMAEAGISTAILEAQGPGFGGSGRNGGQVITCFKDNPEDLIAAYGKERGERMSMVGAGAADLVQDLITRYQIDCAYRKNGVLICVPGKRGMPAIEERARQWQARGLDVRVLNRAETADLIGADLYEGAYHVPNGGGLNPLSFARGLARAAISQGAQLYTNSPAIKIDREGQAWRVKTPKGSVLANRVVIATGAYTTDLIPSLRRSVMPVQSIQVATDPLPEELRRRILPQGHVVADTRRLLLYFRFNERGSFVFGGRGSLGGEQIVDRHVEAVIDVMHRSFPETRDFPIRHVWAGQVDLTPERRVRLHEVAPGLISIIGFSGRGVAIAPAVGKAVAEAVIADDLQGGVIPVQPIRPVPFHSFRLPAMAIAAQWFRLLDKIDAQ